MTYICDDFESGGHFVRVLTSPATGNIFGYRINGGFPGPSLAAFGPRDTVEGVFNALLEIPTLPWMQGALTLVWFEADAHRLSDFDILEDEAPIDHTLLLHGTNAPCTQNRDALIRVLRTATKLGMISGRGVPADRQNVLRNPD